MKFDDKCTNTICLITKTAQVVSFCTLLLNHGTDGTAGVCWYNFMGNTEHSAYETILPLLMEMNTYASYHLGTAQRNCSGYPPEGADGLCARSLENANSFRSKAQSAALLNMALVAHCPWIDITATTTFRSRGPEDLEAAMQRFESKGAPSLQRALDGSVEEKQLRHLLDPRALVCPVRI